MLQKRSLSRKYFVWEIAVKNYLFFQIHQQTSLTEKQITHFSESQEDIVHVNMKTQLEQLRNIKEWITVMELCLLIPRQVQNYFD